MRRLNTQQGARLRSKQHLSGPEEVGAVNFNRVARNRAGMTYSIDPGRKMEQSSAFGPAAGRVNGQDRRQRLVGNDRLNLVIGHDRILGRQRTKPNIGRGGKVASLNSNGVSQPTRRGNEATDSGSCATHDEWLGRTGDALWVGEGNLSGHGLGKCDDVQLDVGNDREGYRRFAN